MSEEQPHIMKVRSDSAMGQQWNKNFVKISHNTRLYGIKFFKINISYYYKIIKLNIKK